MSGHEPQQEHREQKEKSRKAVGRLAWRAVEGWTADPSAGGICVIAGWQERVQSPKAMALMYHDMGKHVGDVDAGRFVMRFL